MVDFGRFRIGFDPADKKRVYNYWNEIFASQRWAEGKFTRLFEEKWERWNGLPAAATSSWAGAAMACLEYCNERGKKVLYPTNTFMAGPLCYDSHPYLHEGMAVEVIRGPLAGVKGILLRKEKRSWLVILVHLIRQAAVVEIDVNAVAPI